MSVFLMTILTIGAGQVVVLLMLIRELGIMRDASAKQADAARVFRDKIETSLEATRALQRKMEDARRGL